MKTFYPFLILLMALFISCSTDQAGKKQISGVNPDTLIIENIFPFQSQHCHGSTLVELPNKDILVAWFQGSGERTSDDVQIMGSRRNYKTGLWDKPFIMADVPDFPDINPVLFIDNQSHLWLTWYTVMAYQWESSILKYRISDNYMQETGAPEWKWQDMIHMKPDGSTPDGIRKNDPFIQTLIRKYGEYHKYLDSAGYLKRPDGGIITEEMWNMALNRYFDIARGANLISNGVEIDEKGEKIRTQLGYPLMRRIGWQTRNKPLFIGNKMLLPLYSDGFDFSLVAITDNYGKTWSFSEPIVGAGCIQPALVLCKDSSIVALMRDNGPAPHRLMKSTSHDSGKTWSTVSDTDIPNPGSAAEVIVLKSGNWVLISNDLDEGRYRLSLWLSKDEGKTWPYKKAVFDAVPGSDARAHYPAIIQSADGLIHVSYTNQIPGPDGQPSVKNIAHGIFSEHWLLETTL